MLAAFFRQIDRDWRGWDGEKQAGTRADDYVAMSARHDGNGHVTLAVRLGEGWPAGPGWSVRIHLPLEVGAAGRIADDLEAWSRSVWPLDPRARQGKSNAPSL